MNLLENVFNALLESPKLHYRTSAFYALNKEVVLQSIKELFSSLEGRPSSFGPFGDISLPYTKMGAINSLDLFGLDELIIFAFYYKNRNRYKKVIDIGANLGLHSIILSRCGFAVKSFEPDPWHYELLLKNLNSNSANNVMPFKQAVSINDGEAEFVRVLGNTTGSHLAGSKDSYGEKEKFTVSVCAAKPLYEWADFAKIDAEGHEKELLQIASFELMQNLDIMVEIGNPENAKAVFKHFNDIGINMFSQKLGWNPVKSIEGMPTSHREGSLFISSKTQMPW
jgi:FkbM family methyltransferase